ncbi:hypothetical protein, partial [Pseudomonas sp.]|uniref:hypothetical protein n=1 Tax=Pseudomonas sp. TaxID=306 RepID=UPI00286D55AA
MFIDFEGLIASRLAPTGSVSITKPVGAKLARDSNSSDNTKRQCRRLRHINCAIFAVSGRS